MTIAMIGQKGLPAIHGGVERHVHELSTGLIEAGQDVLAYARDWYTDETITEFKGVRVVHTPSVHTKHFDTITHTLTATIDAMHRNVDVIHYHGVGPSLLAWIPRIFTPHIRVVGTFHSIDRKHAKWNWFARQILKIGEWAVSTFPHDTVAVSETISGYVRDVYGKDATYIPNGVPSYVPKESTQALTEFGITPNKYFLIVSRLIRHKGIHDAIASYQTLEKTHPEMTREYPLVIVGDGHHTNDYVSELKAQAAGSNIIFTGFQSGDALAELFSHATMFIHPSEHEGLPITVLEAISYGTVSIVSDILEHRLIVPNMTYRFSKETLADTIVRTMNQYPAALSYARTRQRDIQEEFAWSKIVRDLTRTYKQQSHKESLTINQPA